MLIPSVMRAPTIARGGVTGRVTLGDPRAPPRQTAGQTRVRHARCAVAVRSATMERRMDVSGLRIHLLGKPRVERDGEAVPDPRGYKAWGLLAYLLRTDRPPSRDQLVSLLFSEADDPFAAL